MPPELSIIILNWNSVKFLKPCLDSIRSSLPSRRYEIIVIDGASFDGCAELLAKEYAEVRFIQSAENLGFAKCNNIAAKEASGAFLLFLNPDTEVQACAVDELLNVITTKGDAGAVGAKLLNTDGSLQTSCIQSFPTVLNQILDSEFLRHQMPLSPLWGMAPLFRETQEPSEVEAISGACVMIRRDIFAKIGGFEESYFMYSEDLDLSFKVHKAGFKCYFVPRSVVVHHGGGSSKNERSTFSTVMMRESVHRFFKLRRGRVPAAIYRATTGFSAVIRLLLLLPLAQSTRDPFRASCGTSLKKWVAILRWGVGFEKWAQER